MVLPTRGTGKGTPHLLGLVGGGGLSPKTQAHVGSYRECLVLTEVVFLSQDVPVVPVRLTLACRRAAPASPRMPRMGDSKDGGIL